MVEAAERRKKIERRQMAHIVAYAVNAPKELDKLVPAPGDRPAPEGASNEFVDWSWDDGLD